MKGIATKAKQERPSVKTDPRWQAIVQRDSSFDGKFYYGVKTTGIYCRPSCPSRLPKRENVSFFATCDDAEQAGFRTCKRCQPRSQSLAQQHADTIAQSCRAIESAESMPRLQELADAAGFSLYHFHRLFKLVTGVTPRAYAAAHRAAKLRDGLAGRRATVTQSIYNAGFNSTGRFYANSNEVLGMTPTRYRQGGTDTAIRFAIGQCSLGSVLVACSEKGVCAIFMGDQPDLLARDLQDRFPHAELIGDDPQFDHLVAQVVGLVEAPGNGFDLPLDVRGTLFQQRVWRALQQIPVGSTASYTEIAKQIGAPQAVRAVAGACAANPLAVAIPCHRVVRSDGALSGYRWGVERKRALLKKESAADR